MLRTVTFRLTLWYLILITALSLTVFVLSYIRLTLNLIQRVDEELLGDAQEIEELSRTISVDELRAQLRNEAKSDGITKKFFLLLSPDLNKIAASKLSAWKGLDFKPEYLSSIPKEGLLKTLYVPGQQYKVRVIYKKFGNGNIIQIGSSLEDDEELYESYREIFGTSFISMLFFGGLLGWFLASRAMSGVKRVTQTALHIGKGDLTQRVMVRNEGQEVENLALAFNSMLERIQVLITELREVTDRIAHDLRSPITRIRGLAETTLTGEQNVEEYQEMTGMIIEESDRLISMINTMLEIAQTGSGAAEILASPVDMVEIVKNAQELFQPVAEDKGIEFESNFVSEPLFVKGDVTKLQRVIANLIDNAIKFNSKGGKVYLSVQGTKTEAVISIEDSGIGIKQEDIPRIFEKFYRGEQSRSTPGNGLGLSLVQAFIRAHGGEIDVHSSVGKGSTFTVWLPRTV